MTKEEVLRETMSRLYTHRQCNPGFDNKSRNEDYLESIVRLLLDLPDDTCIPVDLKILKSYNIFNAILDELDSE